MLSKFEFRYRTAGGVLRGRADAVLLHSLLVQSDSWIFGADIDWIGSDICRIDGPDHGRILGSDNRYSGPDYKHGHDYQHGHDDRHDEASTPASQDRRCDRRGHEFLTERVKRVDERSV